MPVVKRQHAERFAKDAIVLDLADIVQQGEALRRAAKQEADRIIAEARAERERLIADAREVGQRAGYEEGLAQGREAGKVAGETAARAEHADRLRQIQSAWADALEEFLAQRDHLVIECKQDVLRLAIGVAERVVHRRIECDDEVVCRQIEEALRLVSKPTRVVVSASPDDVELVRDILPDLAARLEGVEHASLVADDSLARGSCIIRTAGGGEVDASIDTQLSRIAEMIVPGSSQRAVDGILKADDAGQERGDLAA